MAPELSIIPPLTVHSRSRPLGVGALGPRLPGEAGRLSLGLVSGMGGVVTDTMPILLESLALPCGNPRLCLTIASWNSQALFKARETFLELRPQPGCVQERITRQSLVWPACRMSRRGRAGGARCEGAIQRYANGGRR